MKIAVTGAGGFLGRAVVARLMQSGHEILALVKSPHDVRALEELKIPAAACDLSVEDACNDLFIGSQAIVHCAGLTRDFGHWDEFKKTNIDSTRNVMLAAQKNSVSRFVYISSAAVYGNERNHFGTDEEADYGARVVDPYSRSKIAADKLVVAFMREQNFPAAVLRLGLIWGPGDPVVLPFIVGNLKKKRLRLIGNGDNVLSLTYIDNAIESIMLAVENPRAIGNVFNIADGHRVTSRKFITDITSILGITPRLKTMSYPTIYFIAYLVERYYHLFRGNRQPPLTRFAARFLKYYAVFDTSKAAFDLGFRPKVPYKEALLRATPYIQSLYRENQ